MRTIALVLAVLSAILAGCATQTVPGSAGMAEPTPETQYGGPRYQY